MAEIKLDKSKISYRFSNWIVNNPLKSLSIVLLFLVVMVPAIWTIKSSYTPKVWFDADHPKIQQLNIFEKRFGNDQTAVIGLYHPDGIFQKEILQEIVRLSDELWKVTDVIRVETVANYNYIYSEEDDIINEPFITEDTDLSPANLIKMKKKALSDEVIPDFYISKDGTYAILYTWMRPYFDGEPDFSLVIDDLRRITKDSNKISGLEVFITGDAAANDAFREISGNDNKSIIPFMILFVMVLLFVNFRSLTAVGLPFILIVITVAITFGAMGWLNLTMSSLLSSIPGVLLAICLADAVHILNTYFHFRQEGKNSKDSTLYSLVKNFQPTLLTSVSTAISFFSITQTEIAPVRDLGILCGFGTLLAWLFTYILLGPILVLLSDFLDKKKVKTFSFTKLVESKSNDSKALARRSALLIDKFKYPIIAIFVTLTSTSIYFSMKNEVNSDPIKYFHESVPVRKAYDFASTKMDGLRGFELVIDSGKAEGVKDPEFLRRLDAYMEWLRKEPEITNVKSIMEVIKKMNKLLHEENEEYYKIPDSNKAVAEILFLYTLGLPQGMDLNNQITLDNRRLRMRVIWTIETSKETEIKVNYLTEKAKEFGITAEAGGNLPIYMVMNTIVVSSFFKSMAMALLLVSLLLLFVFRDFWISFFSMLPNTIPLAMGGAVMFFLGKYVDIGTSLVYTVCLGIAVDDTIHFVASYKNYRADGLTQMDAIIETFHITGKALVVTTLLLVAGFGSFAFADFVPNRNFGMLCSIILTLALLTDLLFLPALLLVVDRKENVAKLDSETAENSVKV